ncbi:MAG: fructosamine kinase family protein, partial [Bacteroidia bacterium]
MLPVAVQSAVESYLSLREGRTIIVTRIQAVTGGNISRAYQVVTPVGSYFLKYKERIDESPVLFEIEARGLDLLQLANG